MHVNIGPGGGECREAGSPRVRSASLLSGDAERNRKLINPRLMRQF
jgi:hypothetical protein